MMHMEASRRAARAAVAVAVQDLAAEPRKVSARMGGRAVAGRAATGDRRQGPAAGTEQPSLVEISAIWRAKGPKEIVKQNGLRESLSRAISNSSPRNMKDLH